MSTKNTIIYVLIVLAVVAIIIFLSFRKSEAPVPSEQQVGAEQKVKNMDNTQQAQEEQAKAQTTAKTSEQQDGVKITVLKEGSGEVAKSGDSVDMNYTGKLLDGTTFDSNVDPKFGHVEPFTFTIDGNMVIKGWDIGVAGMKVGEKRKLELKPEFAYGSRGAGASIPPNSTLIFEVELLKINK